MLNFSNNYNFIRFSVIFYLVVIFGYWGIDLNTEEIFVSFVFLVLVLILFVAFRRSLILAFTRSVNALYNRFLLDILVRVELIEAHLMCLRELLTFLSRLEVLLFAVNKFGVKSMQYNKFFTAFLEFKSWRESVLISITFSLFLKETVLLKYASLRSLNATNLRLLFGTSLR